MLARHIALKRNTPIKFGMPSEKWWKGFMKWIMKHKGYRRATEKFGRVHTSVSAENVASFYDKMLETLTSNKYGYSFLDSPNRIFNCDETAMEFDAISKFACAEKKNLNFMAPFYGWGSTASRLEPLRGGSLLFTTKFSETPVPKICSWSMSWNV